MRIPSDQISNAALKAGEKGELKNIFKTFSEGFYIDNWFNSATKSNIRTKATEMDAYIYTSYGNATDVNSEAYRKRQGIIDFLKTKEEVDASNTAKQIAKALRLDLQNYFGWTNK